MTVKEYLSKFQRLQTVIELKQERIKEIRASASTVSAMCFDLKKVQGGGHTDKVGDNASKIIDLEAELENDLLHLLNLQNDILKQIQGLQNSNHIKLLYKRYIEGKTLIKIAYEMGYAYPYIREMHGKALQSFALANKYVLLGC